MLAACRNGISASRTNARCTGDLADGRVPTWAALAIEEAVPCDPEQPHAERDRRPQLRQGGPGTEECFLSQILSLGNIFCHQQTNRVNAILVLLK